MESGHTFDVMFIREDNRQTDTSVAVARVDKEIYSEIRSLGYQLYIDFSRCRVSDRFHLPQCYKCQKFGHTRNTCPTKSNDVQVCRYCTENHDSKSCPQKGQQDKYKCANCGQNHSSTYFKCSVVQNQVQSLLNRTQCMENKAKNEIRPHVIIT